MNDRALALIPAFNEAGPIADVIRRTQLHVREVVVVDSLSTDDTLAIARRFPNVRVVQRAFDSHAYIHYLHHKYFEVNYGGDGLVPLDKWFGTWHDGSKDGDARMEERFRKKRDRMNAKSQTA